MKKYKVILISGGFDPVHKGHIECINNAKELADEVWIGLNNDAWLKRKKGRSFMCQQERAFIMNSLKNVDWVYIMNPHDYITEHHSYGKIFIDKYQHCCC